ncbi:unnamed protein product [Leptosia nina]|uniref:Uncharacterized protein n=1 Tax=Leptosia nina TaxID=320188 RepID=A0AAV1JDU4_9NEOP
MVELTGDTLGELHQELNFKAAEIFKNNANFDDIKSLEEKSDVDQLFKIEVASKYKNMDYMLKILKGGDSLYISRALKCVWMYDDEYSHIINPEYLHSEVFHHMSLKMKTKMINSIAFHIRNPDRAAVFSLYCKNKRMKQQALKFFIFTSESFKMDLINEDCYYLSKHGYPELFIGNSFALAEAFISTDHYIIQKERFVNDLSYLYNVDENKYLDFVEKHVDPEHAFVLFGCRLSKSVITKHKDRVLLNPVLYVKKIKRHILLRYINIEDAKLFIIRLFPRHAGTFWNHNYYNHLSYLFKFIPRNETYQLLKKAFNLAYGDVPFEMQYKFYYHEYYHFMTQDEKESWALAHLKENKEILGSNNDYIWYKFVSFGHAFQPIKKLIMITPDTDLRNKMIMVLVDTVRNKNDLEALIKYYHNRHNNENIDTKKIFLSAIIEKNNVFELDEACWDVFNKLLYSIEVYTVGFGGVNSYRLICVLYNIIHKIEMHSILITYIDSYMDVSQLKRYSNKLKPKEWDSVYDYLIPYYLKKFKYSIKWDQHHTIENKNTYARYLIKLYECFNKTKEDIPNDVLLFVKSNYSSLKYEKFIQDPVQEVEKIRTTEIETKITPYRLETITEGCLMRLLKKDKQTIMELMPEIQSCIGKREFRLTTFLRKISVYFPLGLADAFLSLFEDCLCESSENYDEWQITKSAIYGIFCLGDVNSMQRLLTENVPEEPKIDHSKIDRKLLVIQEAVCRFACYSRLPVPQEAILSYIKGDYVHFCLPMFNRYLSNLPLPLCLKFIESILNAPLSVQKHGIRLAFKAFSAENLKRLISDVWSRTKNVSLRMLIYKALFDKIINSDESIQDDLFEVIKSFTLTLHDEDQQDVFNLLVSHEMPERFKGDYLQAAWESVKKLRDDKTKNIAIRINVIKDIEIHIEEMDRDYVKRELIDVHTHNMFHFRGIRDNPTEIMTSYNNCLWNVAAKYIVASKNETEIEKSLELLQFILQELHKHWDYFYRQTYTVLRHSYDFVQKLKEKTELNSYKYSKYNVLIFERVLQCLVELTPQSEIYMLTIDLKLYIIAKRIIVNNKVDEVLAEDRKRVSEQVTKELVSFFDDLKTNNILLSTFYNSFLEVVSETFIKMSMVLKTTGNLLLAMVANELIKLKETDNTLLALSLMPLNLSTNYANEIAEFKSIGSNIIKEVKDIKNFEIQSLYYNKFIVNGFQRRFE